MGVDFHCYWQCLSAIGFSRFLASYSKNLRSSYREQSRKGFYSKIEQKLRVKILQPASSFKVKFAQEPLGYYLGIPFMVLEGRVVDC